MDINDLNKRMVRNVFLNIELLLNESENEISEYDIQAFMFLFFRKFLKNTDFNISRESHGKVDCVIENEKTNKIIFYEIKTYFKGNESVNEKDFINDIRKLYSLINKNNNSKAYFFTAGLTNKYYKEIESLSFIKNHIENKKDWKRIDIVEGDSIILRPSVKEINGMSNVMTWEIKKCN